MCTKGDGNDSRVILLKSIVVDKLYKSIAHARKLNIQKHTPTKFCKHLGLFQTTNEKFKLELCKKAKRTFF